MPSREPKKSHDWALEIEFAGKLDFAADHLSGLVPRRGQADDTRGPLTSLGMEPADLPPPVHQKKIV